MDARLPYPAGARLVERPAAAKPCATCGELLGRGYPECTACATSLDRFWTADWAALPTPDAERIVDAEVGEYAWTCVDWALRQLRCAGCRGELAAGAPDCVGCAAADSARWEWPRESLTSNEHTLRAAVVALRAPHRLRASVVSTWRLVVPFTVAGADVSATVLRQVRTHVLGGRYEELAAAESLVELAELPLLPWRRPLSG